MTKNTTKKNIHGVILINFKKLKLGEDTTRNTSISIGVDKHPNKPYHLLLRIIEKEYMKINEH